MNGLTMPDWGGVFVPDASLMESFVRGSLVYLAILILFRVVMKRQAGSLGLSDVMLVVLVSECVSTALSNEAKSVANGIAAVGALLFWNFVLDRLGHRWPWFQRLLEPHAVVLVEDGKPNRENLDREGITDEELISQVREHGIDDLSQVKTARLESEGTVSVIPRLLPEATPTGRDNSREPADLEESVRHFLTVAGELRASIARHEQRASDRLAAARKVNHTSHDSKKTPGKTRKGRTGRK